jgi:hypothetical protein
MPVYTVWMLEETNITISPPPPGGQPGLDGITQGDGSHLLNRTITLNNGNFLETFIQDNDSDFEDNDTSQRLSGAQTIDGTTYAANTVVEAEYRLVLQDANGKQWTVYGYNVNNSSPAYATVEGLAFRPAADGSFPPIGTPLTVVATSEGPSGAGSNPYVNFAEPPCFTPGTLIDTPDGPRAVETLVAGDLVLTRDHGPQPLRWIGRMRLSAADLRARPQHRPVRIAAGAMGDGVPRRPLCLSPQHRMLVSGWRAELLFGAVEVLVPALALVGDRAEQQCVRPEGVTYLHLLFDRHEIIFAEGAAVESLLPGWMTRPDLPPALTAELADLLPGMTGADAVLSAGAARNCLTVREGRLLL